MPRPLRLTVLLLLAVAFAGTACAPLADRGERLRLSELEPVGSGRGEQSYRYLAVATPEASPDDEEAEARRLSWLEQWLREEAAEAEDYRVVSRKVVFRRETEQGRIYDIFYEVRVPRAAD